MLLIVNHFTVLRFGTDFVCVWEWRRVYIACVPGEEAQNDVAHVPVWAAVRVCVCACVKVCLCSLRQACLCPPKSPSVYIPCT